MDDVMGHVGVLSCSLLVNPTRQDDFTSMHQGLLESQQEDLHGWQDADGWTNTLQEVSALHMIGAGRMFVMIFAAIVFVALPGTAKAAGCGGMLSSGEAIVAVSHAGRQRPVHVYVPTSYDRKRSAPLLLNLHGSGSTGKGQFDLSGLRAAADRFGVVIASPDAGIAAGTGYLWNVPGVPTVAGTIPGPEAPDDTAYLVAVADAISREACVDLRRLYATGLSGGGRMASWLACGRADRFAAIAPVVGLRSGRARSDETAQIDQSSCRPSRAVGVLAFAGARDRTNPLAGGEGLRWGYSMAGAMQRWATLNGCKAVAPTTWLDHRHYRQQYRGCQNGGAVEAVIDVDGGHDWRVADSDMMLRFLLSIQLPRTPDTGNPHEVR